MLKKSKQEPLPDFPFSFSLSLPGRKQLAGTIGDVNSEEVSVSFPARQCPELVKNERIQLVCTITDTKKTLPIDVSVKESIKSRDMILFQFKFIDNTRLLRDLDSPLLSYFNRREAFRVNPDPVVPIDTDLAWRNTTAKGTVIDISITGIALSVDASTARRLEKTNRVAITIQLPNTEKPIDIVGNKANFIPMQKNVRYGFEFNRKETANIRKKERLILKYIMQRQLAILKVRAGTQSTPPRKRQRKIT